MPYKSAKIKIEGGQYDRRVKLTPEQKSEIHKNVLGLSQRELARIWNVSRRTIQFILHPEKLEENKKRRAERGGWKQYYDSDLWAETMKEHRRYKQKLKVEGKIK
jgi:hypothetical protein